MVYEAFLNTLKEEAAQALGEGYTLSLRKIQKNNGLLLDGLCISRAGSPVAPAIYLNACYEQYLRGRPMEHILREILNLYREHEASPGLDCTDLLMLKRPAWFSLQFQIDLALILARGLNQHRCRSGLQSGW